MFYKTNFRSMIVCMYNVRIYEEKEMKRVTSL